eukprot:1160573-Pelagomonas_calceolata.AAC.35
MAAGAYMLQNGCSMKMTIHMDCCAGSNHLFCPPSIPDSLHTHTHIHAFEVCSTHHHLRLHLSHGSEGPPPMDSQQLLTLRLLIQADHSVAVHVRTVGLQLMRKEVHALVP